MHSPSLRAVRCPLLIGRDDLLELTDRRLDDVAAGHGQLLLLAGEAGIGKTRFLDAITQKATERGFVAAGGYLAPQDRDVPAASILDLARTMLRMPVFAELGGTLLELCGRPAADDHVRRRQLVFEVVDRMLASFEAPTLLIFEDLQWADDLSLEIIGEVARGSRDRRLLLAGGYRTDEAPIGTTLRDWRSRLVTQRIAEELRLAPLDREETALVTTLILDTGLPAPREVAAAVFERTDGVPLHIEELLGAIGAEARANGIAIREASVPDTIEDAVLARLSHRSIAAQQVARAGAVIGRCFVPDVLAGIMDLPPEALDEPLQELIDNFILEPPGPRGVYDFQHQFLRDAIYRSVPTGDRRRFHARAGEFGAQLEGSGEIHASLHYERAGLPRLAHEAALVGARDAVRVSAHREAFELYRRAVDCMPDDLGPRERASILGAFADEALAIEQNEVGEAMFEAARALYLEADDPFQAAFAMCGAMNARARLGHPIAERLEEIRAGLAALDSAPEGPARDETRANVEILLAVTQIEAMDIESARATIDRYAQALEAIGDRSAVLDAATRRGMVAIVDGDVSGGLAAIAGVAVQAREEGEESISVTAYRDAALWAVRTLRYGQAAGYLSEGLRYADSIEQSYCAHLMQATSAIVSWGAGDWAAALDEAGQAVADPGCQRAPNMARWTLGYVALGRGDTVTAEAELSEAVRFGEQTEIPAYILPPLWGLAEAALLAHAPERAIGHCQTALDLAVARGERALLAPFVVTGVRAYQAAGRPAAGADWFEACRAHIGAMPDVAAGPLAHARGLVALAEGATGVARTALEEAIRSWHASGRTWEASWARLDLASCLIRSNRFAEAVSLAVDVRSIASRLESRPLADRADALQRMARGRVALDEPWRPLTAREFEVARLIGGGLTNAEIADSLGIAPKTASSHVEHILAKLGASRRAEIATWASQVQTRSTSSLGAQSVGTATHA
jgi:DNA-binding CsgD family transcriptional regulator